jgi:hypothetical protein
VGSTPTRATEENASAGHWRAQVAVTHPPPACRFDSCPTHRRTMDTTARCDAGLAARLSISPTRVRFPSASLIRLGVMLVLQSGPQPDRRGFDSRPSHSTVQPSGGMLVDARRSERRAYCGRGSSSLPLATGRLQVGWDPTGFHTAGEPGSIPGPATDKTMRVGQCSFGPRLILDFRF